MKLVVCLAIALSIITITAQSPPAPSFDVTSVKRNTSGGGGMQMRNLPGNVSAFNAPVRQLIRMAYQVQDFQIVGTPAWENTDRFDVEGRFDPTAPLVGFDTPGQRMSAMMKSLLRDRFGLVAHTETREMPILALLVARRDGRLGAQLKPAAVDCAATGRGRGPIDGRGGPGAPFSLGDRPACGDRMGFGQLLAGGMPMARLATQVLSPLTGRLVIDRTGLTGTYDIDLEWSPTPDQLPPGPRPPGFVPPPIDPNGPSLFAALQEQLGLKLETDRLQPPAEN
jgi:uncharacterized protein (TIGR03435 family)